MRFLFIPIPILGMFLAAQSSSQIYVQDMILLSGLSMLCLLSWHFASKSKADYSKNYELKLIRINKRK